MGSGTQRTPRYHRGNEGSENPSQLDIEEFIAGRTIGQNSIQQAPDDTMEVFFQHDVENNQLHNVDTLNKNHIKGLLQQQVINEDRIDNLGSTIDSFESELTETTRLASELADGQSDLENRISDLEQSVERDPKDLTTRSDIEIMELLYDSTMLTGAISAAVAAIAVGLAYNLIFISAVLVVISIFFGRTYQRGLKPAYV